MISKMYHNQHVEQICLNELCKEIRGFFFFVSFKYEEYLIKLNDIHNAQMPAILLNET